MTDGPMTKAERDELSKILKARARVANRVVEQRAAELEADVEAKLAATFKAYDPKWKDLTAAAEQVARDADAQLTARCRMLGIPDGFRPGLALHWYSRGENAARDRRAELRRVAQTRIDALAKRARVTIETQALDGLTRLAQGALASAEARAFLGSMPTVEALMPAIDVSVLGPLALAEPDADDALE